jgi:all-trans-retinol dehydrogenase (NAD+)
VAAKVVRAVIQNQQEVRIPSMLKLVPVLRILPVSLFDWLAGFLGVHESMDCFVGRSEAGTSVELLIPHGLRTFRSWASLKHHPEVT